MAVTTWTAGEVLTAADLNDTFASKVDYALPVNAQTGTTYTFVAADAEKLTTASNAAAVTLTIPPQSSVTWSDNTVLRVVNYGAGAVTIDGGSGVTVTNTSSTIAQYGAAVAIRTGSDAWTVVPFGGGDIPAATVSSPAATGQYTDTGITYDYYTFTASGTLTVDTAGFADVLVVGGGAGGGAFSGGGGAGGHLEMTDVYLSAGSHTVTIGAGGGGGNPTTIEDRSGYSGAASRLGSFYSPTGGTGGDSNRIGNRGASGGGGANTSRAGGAGTTGIGNNGGTGASSSGGGGGGGNANGSNAGTNVGGAGGAGKANSFTGSSVTRCGGGGGGGNSSGGSGGSGGGGAGVSGGTAGSGSANTGGGGGSAWNGNGGSGGSGVVIVRVKV